jgi:tetratricopeptide (TPR) repeat protein
MARRRKDKKKDETLVDIVEARESAAEWLERNQNIVLGVIVGLVILIGGWFAYKNLYQIPRNIDAQEQMFQAQFQFERDSFALALENPGAGYPGFLGISSQYSGTKAGNLARYYAGVSYLNLGRFDDAVDHLRKYNSTNELTAIMKHGALGDAYSELNDMDSAIDHYRRAVRAGDNSFLTPYYMNKYGLALLHQNRADDALNVFQDLKARYPNSNEGINADQYIARAKAK